MPIKKNIISLLSEYNVELKKEGTILRAYCPFHDDTGRPNFTVYEETDSWYCWACKEGGDKIQFVAKMEGISYSDAKLKVEGVELDLDELQEKIDGAGFYDDPPSLNTDTNIAISKTVRKFLKRYPERANEVFVFLKELDAKLQSDLTYDDMKVFLQGAYSRFGNL